MMEPKEIIQKIRRIAKKAVPAWESARLWIEKVVRAAASKTRQAGRVFHADMRSAWQSVVSAVKTIGRTPTRKLAIFHPVRRTKKFFSGVHAYAKRGTQAIAHHWHALTDDVARQVRAKMKKRSELSKEKEGAYDAKREERKKAKEEKREVIAAEPEVEKTPISALRSGLHLVMRTAFDLVAIFFVALSVVFLYVYHTTPKADFLVTRAIPQTTIIYDRSGQHVLYEIHGEENRKIISHDDIPDYVRQTAIAAEDDRFYKHNGVDFLSILRAARENISQNTLAQGASTITQQLVRNAFFTREKTYQRKFKEIVMATKIERAYSKDDILDLYLNEVPYGSNAYGVQSAAEIFFGKNADQLTLDESALLAALPKATTYYSPYGNHTDALVARQKAILSRLIELDMYEPRVVEAALAEDTMAKIKPFREDIDVPHFVFYVREFLEQKYGKDAIEQGGFSVYTTLDYDMQKQAEDVIRAGVERNQRYRASNAALVALDPRSGEVLAMVGSVDYFNEAIDGEVNVALRLRQPGSSFKPIAYAKAFEKGFQPETLMYDARTDFGPDGSGRNYVPQNYDGGFHGLVSLRKALAGSLNIPAVKVLYLAGIDDTIDLAERLGMTTFVDRNRYGLSLVLGGGEVTLLEETAAFSVFANDGIRHPVDPILRIEDVNGVFYDRPRSEGERALDPDVARKVNSILSDNRARSYVFGSSNPLYISGKTVAAKTGTTQEYRDAWTVGYTPSLAVGVWVGNNDNTAMRGGSAGALVAAPIWNDFMVRMLENREEEQFFAYEKVKSEKELVAGRPPKETGYFKKGRTLF